MMKKLLDDWFKFPLTVSCLALMLTNLDLDCIADVECQPSGKRFRDEPISPYSTRVDSFSHFGERIIAELRQVRRSSPHARPFREACKFYIHLQCATFIFLQQLTDWPWICFDSYEIIQVEEAEEWLKTRMPKAQVVTGVNSALPQRRNKTQQS